MITSENIHNTLASLMGVQKKTAKTVKNISKKTDQILKVEKKEVTEKSKENKEERKYKNRLAQLEKRKEKNQGGGGFLSKLYTPSEKKKTGKNLGLFLLGILGIASVAGAANWIMGDTKEAKDARKAIVDKIGEGVKWVGGQITDLIGSGMNSLKDSLGNFVNGILGRQKEEEDKIPTSIPSLEGMETDNGGLPREDLLRRSNAEDKAALKAEKDEDKQAIIQRRIDHRNQQLYDMEMMLDEDVEEAEAEGVKTVDITSYQESDGYVVGERRRLTELGDTIKERQQILNKLAEMEEDDEFYEIVKKELAEKDEELQKLIKENASLVEKVRSHGKETAVEVQVRQKGGVVDVPGTGSGDKIPMMLAPGSFVLNREASKLFPGFDSGGEVQTPTPSTAVPAPKRKAPASVVRMAPRMATGGVAGTGASHPGTKTGGARSAGRGAMSSPAASFNSINYSPQLNMGITMPGESKSAGGMGGARRSFKMPRFGFKKGGRVGRKSSPSMGTRASASISSNPNPTKSITPMMTAGNPMAATPAAPQSSSPSYQYIRSAGPAYKAPEAPQGYQTGGTVSAAPSAKTQRLNSAQADFMDTISKKVSRPIVTVKRSAIMRPMPQPIADPPVLTGGGGLNIFEMSGQLHRILAGDEY